MKKYKYSYLSYLLLRLSLIVVFFISGCSIKQYVEKNDIVSEGIEFVYIEPGEFVIGSPATQGNRGSDEKQRKVKIERGFYMQTTEVTLDQWQSIMGKEQYVFFKECGGDCPVVRVNMPLIESFISRLNAFHKTDKYRLPTEEEWEYACRAGSTDTYCFGDNNNQLNDYAWFNHNSNGKIQQVAKKKANKFGLYDMHGNVWEQCSDCAYYHSTETLVNDSKNPERCSSYVIRGGGATSEAKDLRAANRHKIPRPSGGIYIGFRLVRDE